MNKGFVKNIINLMISNLISLMISVLSSFITPVILGHDGYGYYKIFSLYTTYVPLLHIGFIDGILIRNAGKKLDNISFEKFRTYTLFLLIFELFLSIVMSIFACLINIPQINREIIIAIAIYSFLLNALTYFQFFSKCIMRFSELASIARLQSFINLFFLLLALYLYKFTAFNVNVTYYMFYMNFAVFILLCYYLVRYKKIILGERKTIASQFKNIRVFFRVGFAIMISYQITMVMVNADNQFISMFFKVSEYGKYAFAYSLAALLLTVFNAVSSVMLPYMKKVGKSAVVSNHDSNMAVMNAIVFFVIASYYPIAWIVNNFIASYSESVQYLSIVFPGVGITCIVQSYIFNDYIMAKKIKDFCYISLANLVFDFAVYYVGFILSHSTLKIALLSIPLLMIWYLTLEWFMNAESGVKFIKNFYYLMIMAFAFIVISHISNIWISLIAYVITYVAVTLAFYFKTFKTIILNL
ncbi:oligosaccharide flippase family protein [Apilactobacillus kunkeei]|uniref:Heteropolysaccharide repeat-containing protein n=1 Tax=Apilactobacillus kunkeei TaxID=148814 RepID=A0A1L8CHL6_9LACO|nr:oligosaccharide flippase family protein [Apilactobacillus kunkeei]GAT90693.1 heteropolysaccharide repeat-containing protein [Apilactobacillus kunkeei]